MLTGQTLAGASQTSDERIGSFIDVVGNYLPISKMSKYGNPGSWYNFKNSNKHIPILKKKSIYEAEKRRYKAKVKGNKAFGKVKGLMDKGTYINNQIEKEEK